MPELPEVETIVRYLRPQIAGKIILGIKVNEPRIFRYVKNPRNYIKNFYGEQITELERLGKNIIFKLSGNKSFALHLMMTGRLLVNPKDTAHRHCRALFKFKDGTKLGFFDIRKFGMIRDISELSRFGPDALSVSGKIFKQLISQHSAPIKLTLLNQAIISGVGNIYADEALWHADIHPKRKGKTLTYAELKKLYRALNLVLHKAVRYEGTSSRDYRKPDGSKGGYFKIRKAYQRTGEHCHKRDGGIIKRIVIGQRSAHFCPKHQI